MTAQFVARIGSTGALRVAAYDTADIGQWPLGHGLTYGRVRLPGEAIGSATLTITGLPSEADIVVLTAGTTTVLHQVDALAATFYDYTYPLYVTSTVVDIGIIRPGYQVLYLRSFTLPSNNSVLPVAPPIDRNFS